MSKYVKQMVTVEGLNGTYECYVKEVDGELVTCAPYFTEDTVRTMVELETSDVRVYFNSDHELVTVFYTQNMLSQLEHDEPLTEMNMCDCMEIVRPDVIAINGVTHTMYAVGCGWSWHKCSMMFKFTMHGSEFKVGIDADYEVRQLDIARALNDIGFYGWDTYMVRSIEGCMYTKSDIHIGPVSVTYELMDLEICK